MFQHCTTYTVWQLLSQFTRGTRRASVTIETTFWRALLQHGLSHQERNATVTNLLLEAAQRSASKVLRFPV